MLFEVGYNEIVPMQNNKNKVLIRVKKKQVHYLLVTFFLISALVLTNFSQAQPVDVESDLFQEIIVIETRLLDLAAASEIIENEIDSYDAESEELVADLNEVSAELLDLTSQKDNLTTKVINAEDSILTFDTQQYELNIEIDALNQKVTQLTQDRLEIVSASSVKEAELAAELLKAQEDLLAIEVREQQLITRFDYIIGILNEYLLRIRSVRFQGLIERYIRFYTTLRDRYLLLIENSKDLQFQKITQINQGIESLNTET